MSTANKATEILKRYMPEAAVAPFTQLLQSMPVHMNISRPRKGKFGDFRPATQHKPARISVNNDMPPGAFLLTAVHEMAHAKVHFDYQGGLGNRIKAHGPEWKAAFKTLMQPFLCEAIYPKSHLLLLQDYFIDPAASTARHITLYAALHQQTEASKQNEAPKLLLQDIADGKTFVLNGNQYTRLCRLRKYIKCKRVNNGKLYRIHPLAEVAVAD